MRNARTSFLAILALVAGTGTASAQILLHEVPSGPSGKGAETGPFDLDQDGKGDFIFDGIVYSGADASPMLDITQVAGLPNIRVTAVSDLGISGDGVVDFVALKVHHFFLNPYSPEFYVVSGADGSLLMQRPLAGGGEVGSFVRNVGDADGDGWEDLIAGTSWFEGPCWYEMGQVAFVSGGGESFTPFYFNQNGQNVSYGFGVPLGDINADGKTEFAVGGSCGNGQSIYTAALGGPILPLRTLNPPTIYNEDSIASVGDFNGDGRDDHARVVSGTKVAIISGLRSAQQLQVFFNAGDRVTGPGDVDCDGVPDLLATAPYLSPMKTKLLSGRDGKPLWTAPETAQRVVEVGDVDGDGRPDLGLDLGTKMQIWSPYGLGGRRCNLGRERAPKGPITR